MKLFLVLLMVMTVVLESQAAAKPQQYWGREGGAYYQPAYEGGGWQRPAYESGWYRQGAESTGWYVVQSSSEEGK
jgi:hypothetical protein